MSDLISIASFPGATSIQTAAYTLTHGISPGMGTIVCNPGVSPQAVGNLTFSDGTRTVTIPNCRVDSGSFELSRSGKTVNLRVFDRRWMWQYGEISGHYNDPVPRIADVPKIQTVVSGNQTAAGNQGNPNTPDYGADLPAIQEDQKKDARIMQVTLGENG